MYRIHLDREACEGIFACLVRDERFVEAADGLAAIEGGVDAADAGATAAGDAVGDGDAADRTERVDDAVVATFDDDRIEAARKAAAACPVDAITVEER